MEYFVTAYEKKVGHQSFSMVVDAHSFHTASLRARVVHSA